MIEKVYRMTPSKDKMMEKLVVDENVNIAENQSFTTGRIGYKSPQLAIFLC